MSNQLGRLAAVAALSLLAASASVAQEEMVDNPYYKFWASSKPGATSVRLEQTKLSGADGKLGSDGVDEKRIAYKLIEVNKDRAVVEMVVTEKDLLGFIQAAPTRYIYPAKLKKAQLERIHTDGKAGEDTVKVAGKEMKTKTITGVIKGAADGEQIDFKLWLSDEVPGSIVKHVRTARQKDSVIAETTTTLQSFKNAD
jgi:hypothetical protein